ncbi:Low molecular weight protein-tyrosine-phosphatase [Actinidia chinensis var. chinensis]|uniref:Low molecular weight protein-tyrosine-phosphatase n=1 Tax=Actinidia chinensis var. chinensis TaxID=1590841 RepID=A0A2R6PEZ8_ACTCC|nr:Low molecular weight protein-tyrosine-phosphatase [Actinidia chinensis var. chinensis]
MASSTPSTTETETETDQTFSVLFVCLGNICISPAVEGVITDLVKKWGLDSVSRLILLVPSITMRRVMKQTQE